jgi:hypothetical protein
LPQVLVDEWFAEGIRQQVVEKEMELDDEASARGLPGRAVGRIKASASARAKNGERRRREKSNPHENLLLH